MTAENVDAEGSPSPPSSSRSGDPPRRSRAVQAVDAEAQSLRHSEAEGRGIPRSGAHAQQWTREGRRLLRHPREDSPASDANPAKRIASEKEEQGSERSFRREVEAESSGLCDDAIPH